FGGGGAQCFVAAFSPGPVDLAVLVELDTDVDGLRSAGASYVIVIDRTFSFRKRDRFPSEIAGGDGRAFQVAAGLAWATCALRFGDAGELRRDEVSGEGRD